MKNIRIRNRIIGDNQPVFVIAEAGINHNQDLNIAMKLVDQAKECGADAIKFQTFKAERLVSFKAEATAHQGGGESQLELVRKMELPEEFHYKLKEYADKRDILFFSSPLSIPDAEFLEKVGVDCFKIASCMLPDYKLLEFVGNTKKPVIMSTGMADISEISEAIAKISQYHENLAIMHCLSLYPPADDLINLKTMDSLKEIFSLPTGYSDHCLHPFACLAAVSRGANIIEKHFTLDKTLPGPDHTISADPLEFKDMVTGIRRISKIIGKTVLVPGEDEKKMRENFGISLVAKTTILKGDKFSDENICVMRPGNGLQPKWQDWLVGRIAGKNIERGDSITWECV